MRHETIKDFRARIAAMARGGEPNKPAYEAPHMDAVTLMRDLEAGIVRPGREVRGPRPPERSRRDSWLAYDKANKVRRDNEAALRAARSYEAATA